MFVIIVENANIVKSSLKDAFEYKGINIYPKNDIYYLDLKSGLFFNDGSKTKILNIGKYIVTNNEVYYDIEIYVYENDNGINDYKLYKDSNFVIAYDDRANIRNLDINSKDYYLMCKDHVLNSNYHISVNGSNYNGEELRIGDHIEFIGISIFYFEDFLYINSFNIENKLCAYKYLPTIIRYKNTEIIDNYYIPEDIYEIKVDEIKKFSEIKKPNNIDFIKTIMPNLIMCISMSVMAYINYLHNNQNSNIAQYIIMPISMLMSSILLPIIFVICSNVDYRKKLDSEKRKYLKYLDDYYLDLKNEIDKYIESMNSRYFDILNSKGKMFYASSNSDEFLKLSIGKIKYSLDINIENCNIDEINDMYRKIENLSNDIDDYPLYLDIYKNSVISVVCKKADRINIFYKYLLELSYKHHYDDIYIAVYSKDANIFNSFYNLPHLFFNNVRLTISSIDKLQQIDQIKIDKPLILLLLDRCNLSFNNPNIHTLYFSSDIKDIAKNSDVIVEYLNNTGFMYLENRIKFRYYHQDINYQKYFGYLGKFKSINDNSLSFRYFDVFKDTIFDYYRNNDYGLKASFSYSNNELISFDLHESKQGPHGLIGGTTGSGKSELIVSMLLSLAIRYSPEYLNIVLIDYKGGGIKESLTYNGICIPHIVASISNLENNALNRLIIALKNECKYRQELFKSLSSIVHISIMNIDDYLINNKSLDNISHLLIVVDEFAELKKENPEAIKELISISRIGRSLGIHLILATQKPAGVIDEEIWSNSRFKIALKVFDEKDSMDIIKRKDAAYLSTPGSFYMLVDSGISKGQSIYTKSDVYGKDPYVVSILDEELQTIKSYKKQVNNILTVSSFYTKQIIDCCTYLKTKVRKIEYLPAKPMYRKDISINGSFIFGQIDDYINQNNKILSYKITDSILVYSTRKNEINGILNTLNENCRYTIVISNKQYNGKYISDSIEYNNSDDITYLYKKLLRLNNLNVTLVIEDLYTLLSYEESYVDMLCKLMKRKDVNNINVVCLTSNPNISFKIINAFTNKVLINIYEQADISLLCNSRSKYIGSSYFMNDEPITFVPINVEEYVNENTILNKFVISIPDVIKPNINDNKFLVGYDEETKLPVYVEEFVVVSYDTNLLDIYHNAYPSIETYSYNHSLRIENRNILWLGSGIFSQRLFITGRSNDLDNNHGFMLKQNEKIIIRRINNAPKINEV